MADLVERLRGPVREAASRLIAGSFRRDGERLDEKRPRFSIPARPDEDDDLVLIAALEEAAAALEAEASEARCMCRGVEIGSHMASVSLPIPGHMADYREARVAAGLSPMISVDACLVVELRLLWARGIRTYGSCCGHNKVRGMINVHEDDTAAMLAMGYDQCPEKDGMAVATFYPKSVRRSSAFEGERRGVELRRLAVVGKAFEDALRELPAGQRVGLSWLSIWMKARSGRTGTTVAEELSSEAQLSRAALIPEAPVRECE